LIAEYNESRESFLFMYQTSWQIGSMIIWLLFFKRYRQVAYVYWDRLLEIEKELGMNSELLLQKHFKEKKIIQLNSYACAVLLAITMISWLSIRYGLFKI
jgi:hypothetical protein